MTVRQGDFYEEDEPLADALWAFDAGAKGLTVSPPKNSTSRGWTLTMKVVGSPIRLITHHRRGPMTRTLYATFGPIQPKWVFGPLQTTTGQVNPVILTSLSKVYVQTAVTATAGGVAVNPTADVVEMAFVPIGSDPGALDWHTGSWDTALASNTYLAQVLIGTGGVVLTKGTYAVWVRITDSPEIPVDQIGTIQIV